MNVSLFEFEQGHSNQRSLAEAPRGEQEHFLAVRQVSDELGEFVSSVDKVGVVDDFAKTNGFS
jgi:hypothetical protein